MKRTTKYTKRFNEIRRSVTASTTKFIFHRLLERESFRKLRKSDNPRVFTLPADSMAFESSVASFLDGNVEMEGVESNAGVYRSALSKIREHNLPLTLHKMDDLDYWTQRPVDPFNLIWLDYCGPWSPAKFASVEEIFRRGWLKFEKGMTPLLAITLMEGMDLECFSEFSIMLNAVDDAPTHGPMVRMRGIPMWINAIAASYGMAADLSVIHSYRDTARSKQARPMLCFIFKILPEVRFFDFHKTPVVTTLNETLDQLEEK